MANNNYYINFAKDLKHLKKYSFLGLINLVFNKIYTVIVWPQAQLVRRPAYIRSAGTVKMGRGVMCGPGLIVDLFESKSVLEIGRNVKMNHRVHIGVVDNISIGENVLIGSNVTIIDHEHGDYKSNDQSHPDEAPLDRKWKVAPIRIGNGVWICDNVVITEGVVIGDYAVIGANSVVKECIPPSVIACGNPAKVVKRWDESSQKWLRV